jgi:hypothetical protein
MSHPEPEYKLLYEQSQQKKAEMEAKADRQLAALEQQLFLTEQKLQLALLEIYELRAKLFGSKSDKRVKKATGKELDILPLGATPVEVATSEGLLKAEVAQVEQGQQKAVEKRAKVPLPVWCCLLIWSERR